MSFLFLDYFPLEICSHLLLFPNVGNCFSLFIFVSLCSFIKKSCAWIHSHIKIVWQGTLTDVLHACPLHTVPSILFSICSEEWQFSLVYLCIFVLNVSISFLLDTHSYTKDSLVLCFPAVNASWRSCHLSLSIYRDLLHSCYSIVWRVRRVGSLADAIK